MSLTFSQIEELFDRERKTLARRLTRFVRSKEIAADLVQETFVRLLGLVGGKQVLYPRALLFRTATNLAIDHLRKSQNERATDHLPLEEGFEVSSKAPTQDREVLGKQQLGLVQQVIKELPPRTREAFLLHREYNCSYEEIAERLGISESAVEKLINRALVHCWSALDQD